MTWRDLLATLAGHLSESLIALLGFFEGLAKIIVARALSLVLAVSVTLAVVLAFQHAETFTGPLLAQARDTVLAVMRAVEADALSRLHAEPGQSDAKRAPAEP